jgi:hypothetical protein
LGAAERDIVDSTSGRLYVQDGVGFTVADPGEFLAPTHTSELLEDLVAQAPDGPVDLEWLLGHLDKRSFGLLLLLLGLLVIIPGVATVATLALLFPAAEMMLGRNAPSFPRALAKRPFDFKRFKRLTKRMRPVLLAIESVSRPRWNAHRDVTDRLVGLVVFLLALLAGWPLPLVNILPGLVVVLIAIAYLQEDGLLLTIAGTAAIVTISGLSWTVGTSAGAIMRWVT